MSEKHTYCKHVYKRDRPDFLYSLRHTKYHRFAYDGKRITKFYPV